MSNFIYIAAKKIIGGSYGRLYNWFCTQPQITGIKYGYLYNGYSVFDSRNITSSGSHVPTDAEWNTLFTYLGGPTLAGYKLSETGAAHWDAPHTSATNISNFNARGAGYRANTGVYSFIKSVTYFWGTGGIWKGIDWGGSITAFSISSKYGGSVRPLKDATTLTHGQTGTYTGNDGRIYKTICIGAQEWLSENLAETKYRNGDLINKVTDNTAWAALTTGAMCAYNNDEANAFETASIAPVGWHVPTITELATLETAVGGASVAGGKLKEMGLVHWLAPNTGATNEFGFNAKGAGLRGYDGSSSPYENLKNIMYIWSCTPSNSSSYEGLLSYIMNFFSGYEFSRTTDATFKVIGASLRPIKDDSTFAPGDTVTDIDGNVYPLVKIGDQVWTAKNWKCTKLNDGTPIPLITDNAEWAARTEMAQCVYNNDLKNL